jgi:uncharacterized membrane protein YhdT
MFQPHIQTLSFVLKPWRLLSCPRFLSEAMEYVAIPGIPSPTCIANVSSGQECSSMLPTIRVIWCLVGTLSSQSKVFLDSSYWLMVHCVQMSSAFYVVCMVLSLIYAQFFSHYACKIHPLAYVW